MSTKASRQEKRYQTPNPTSTTTTSSTNEQDNGTRVSLKQFQQEVQERNEKEAIARRIAAQQAHLIAVQAKEGKGGGSIKALGKKIEGLSVAAVAEEGTKVKNSQVGESEQADLQGAEEEEEDDDKRALIERLISPTESTTATIAALLATRLHLHHGEIELQFGQHNLTSTSLSTLFDTPSQEALPTESLVLNEEHANKVTETIRSIAAEIKSDITILDNPYDEQGMFRIELKKEGTTETPSAVNDEPTTARWRNKSLRIMVRRIAESAQDLNEVRVAVVGNVDAGKSSLLGVLTKGRLDDGRGRARVSLFRHKHEIESGRTSSVGMELLGFTSTGQEIMPEAYAALTEKISVSPDTLATQAGTGLRKQQLSWEEISSRASKVISFSDLAGHERYLKTTLFGLTATSPDFVLLIVGANAGLIGMSKEHLSVALALSVPVVCVVTKIDSTPAHVLEQTVKQLVKILRSPGCRKQPVFVRDAGTAVEIASSFVQAKACPIFLVSNVTGEGLPLLKQFLNVAPIASEGQFPLEADFEFSISDVFSVPFVGAVASGTILSGRVAVGDTVLLGPDSLGAFTPTAIKSIQRKRVNVNAAEAGQSVSFALKRVKRSAIRKGMVLLARTEIPPVAVQRFEGQVLILYHNTLISPHYQAMMHLGPIRQTVQIESIVDKPCIRTGDRATVQFRFIKHAEFIRVGDRFLFREGRTKALGVVTKLLPLKPLAA